MNVLDGVSSKVQLDMRQGQLFSHPEYILKKSASSIVPNVYGPDSLSTSNVTWSTIQPPSKATLIDRRWYLDIQMTVNLTGDSKDVNTPLIPVDQRFAPITTGEFAGYSKIKGQWLGLRANAFNSCIGNTQLSINNVSMTNNTSQFVNVLPFTYTPDMYNVYNQVANPDTYQQIIQFESNNNNPIASYGQSEYQASRGDVEIYVNSTQTSQAATLLVKWKESLIVPGVLHFNGQNMGGALVGVSNINLVLSLQNIQNCMEIASYGIYNNSSAPYDPVPTISSISLDQCNLLLTYITPSIATPPIPLPQKYNYHNFYSLITNAANAVPAAGAYLTQTTSNNIQLSTIPSKVLIYVGRSQQKCSNQLNYQVTDTLAYIDRVSINFNNQSGLLAGANSYQLWQMSVQNGLCMSYKEWKDYKGSLLILDFSRDLPSNPASAVGASETNNFVVQATWSDINPNKVVPNINGSYDPANPIDNPQLTNYSLYTIFIYDEVLTIDEHATSVTNSYDAIKVITDLASGKVDTSILDFEMYQHPQAIGTGSFWSDIGKSLRKGLSSVGDWIGAHKAQLAHGATNVLSGVASALAPEFSPGIALANRGINALIDHYLGKGYSEDEIHSILASQYPRTMIESALAQARGGELVGGRRVSKKRLVKRRY